MARAARLRMFRLAGADGWWPPDTVAAADLRTSMCDARVALTLALGEIPDIDGYIIRQERNSVNGNERPPGSVSVSEEESLYEQMCQLAHDIEDDDVAGKLIRLAAKVRGIERTR